MGSGGEALSPMYWQNRGESARLAPLHTRDRNDPSARASHGQIREKSAGRAPARSTEERGLTMAASDGPHGQRTEPQEPALSRADMPPAPPTILNGKYRIDRVIG